METIGNILHVNLLEFTNWFISIRISKLKDHYISVDQAKYSTYVVAKYLDTSAVKTSTIVYKTTLPSDIIFTKDSVSTSDEKGDKLSMDFNQNYKACIVSLIYFMSTGVYLSFAAHKLAKFFNRPW